MLRPASKYGMLAVTAFTAGEGSGGLHLQPSAI